MHNKSIGQNALTGALTGALVLCCFFTGGFSWELCIIPSVLLTLCMAMLILKSKANISSATISLVLIVLSALSVFATQGDAQSSIYEAQKIILFVTAFYISSVKDTKSCLLKTLSFLSASVAIIGFLAYANILKINEFVFLDSYIPRLQSVIKYANTTAVFLAMGYISCLCSYKSSGKKIYILLSAIVLPAIYLTLSKAMIPIFIIAGTAYVFFEKDLREAFVHQNILSAILSAAVIYLASRHSYSLCFVLLCLLIALSYSFSFRKAKSIFTLWLVLLGIGLVMALAVLVIKFESLSTLAVRLMYAKDSTKLIPHNPLLGCGQGSWQYLQHIVQESGYSVKYIHNSYLQFAVENGLVFTAVLIFVFAYSLITAFRSKSYGICAMLLTVFAHSFIDFDMSFGIILIILGLLCGGTFNKEKHFCNPKAAKIIIAVSAIICMGVCVYSTLEFAVRDNFERAYVNQNYEKAESFNNTLIRICPKDPQVYINRASLKLKKSKDVTPLVEKDLKKAVILSPNDYSVLKEYIKVLSASENIEALTKRYINLCPKQEECYTFIKETLKKLLDKNEISDKKYDEILNYTENMRIKNKVKDRNSLLKEKSEQ